ncbi:MAG: pilus assembly PilX N-terminal domain-containing protein, partial [Pseudomonadota bacterium]|nr:pilus assembly PilX N-terminal domain-containing protein [Pseudomonadota bacterium]
VERGVAALAVTMLLFFTMVLGIGFVNRNLIFEQRASANQYRSTQAFEAAEAGLEWALAQLNDNQRVDADCLPTDDATATSFRERYLGYEPLGMRLSAATWLDGGVPTALQPSCVRTATGWRCSCPVSERPGLSAPEGSAAAPAFTLRFQSVAQPGLVRVIAVGCTNLAGACVPGDGERVDATAQVQVLFGLLPALRTAPAAALTARGSIDAGVAALGARNSDAASGGLALHAGDHIDTAHARLSVPAGGPAATAVVEHDTALANLTPAQFFAAFFGVDNNTWRTQPVVRHVTCTGDCTEALSSAIGRDAAASLVHVNGDVTISGPVALGSVQRPVVIIAAGTVRLSGAVAITGAVYGGSVVWNDTTGPGAVLRGALISETDYAGNGAPDIVYDAAVLARLNGNAGGFARVNGSWRDF